MKISELIRTLQARLATHGDLEVEVTWQSSSHGLTPEHIYRSRPTIGEGSLLFIDGDENYYKNDFAADPNEGLDE